MRVGGAAREGRREPPCLPFESDLLDEQCRFSPSFPVERHTPPTTHPHPDGAMVVLAQKSPSMSALHPKSRCPGCGLWIAGTCKFCNSQPNRWQVAAKKAATASLAVKNFKSSESTTNHVKERCPGCGLWKTKRMECSHCTSRPNRLQLSSSTSSLDKMSFADAVLTATAERAVTSPGSATASSAVVHTKERCTSCGYAPSPFRLLFCSPLPTPHPLASPAPTASY